MAKYLVPGMGVYDGYKRLGASRNIIEDKLPKKNEKDKAAKPPAEAEKKSAAYAALRALSAIS